MAIIPLNLKLSWYDPSQPGGVVTTQNDNVNTATSAATQYTMQDIINTVSYSGGAIDGSGTANQIAVFTDSNTIGDSVISQNAGATEAKVSADLTIGFNSGVTGSRPITLNATSPFFTEIVGAEIITVDNGAFTGGQNMTFKVGNDTGVATSDVMVLKGGNQSIVFSGYGSGSITGTAAYTLAVDANGNVIEEAGGAPTFTSSNSSASGRLRIGATASASSTSADAVFIGSDLTNNNNDEQINIGHGNDGTGTQNIVFGSDNTQTGNGAYSILIGTLNQASGNESAAVGRNNNLATGATFTFGRSNQSSFTGGVSSGGLMNLSVGEGNEVDCDKAAVFGFANDLSGSFGWTLGSGKEAVVIGTRFNNTLLGPNRSGANRSGPRVIIGTGSSLNTGVEEKRNSVEYYQPEANHSGVYHPALYNSASYADDTAAAAGGVGLGELYRNGSVIQIRMT